MTFETDWNIIEKEVFSLIKLLKENQDVNNHLINIYVLNIKEKVQILSTNRKIEGIEFGHTLACNSIQWGLGK